MRQEEMGVDPQEAHKWLTLAAERDNKETKNPLKEASAAKKNEKSYSLWLNRWQPVFNRD